MRDADRHRRVRDAFHRIVAPDVLDRHAALSDACRTEPDLRDELESLLRYAADGDALDGAAETLRVSWRATGPMSAPETIGRFRLIRPIGSGGMGVVYLAEQDHPRRTVAVKVLNHALADGRHRRRFELESEILGRLDHPGIAGILEAGCEKDRPYLVMEFVDGRPLDAFAREARLDRRARVRLIVDLCDAVAHAHQRGVVHRDLKPANILVTAEGRLRVLDFGIARVSGLSDLETIETHAGELMGTVPYMSREQLEGDRDVDVRADVYAIGVIAYELLSGRRPFDLLDEPLAAAIRRALETEPPPLGARAPGCAGDLEIIVGKAMRPLRRERYANVVELAADLRRFLDHEPITARPPSTIYQVRKFAERNRGLVIAALAGVAMLLATILVVGAALFETTRQRNAAVTARTEAGAERDEARRAGDATRRQRDAYLSVIAFSDLDRERTEALARSLADEGELDAILAHAFAARGWFVDARTHALRAIARHDASGDTDLETLHELLWISICVDDASNYSLREARWREISSAMLAERHPPLAAAVAALEASQPDAWSREYAADQAESSLDRLIELSETLPDDDLTVQLVADRLEASAMVFSRALSPVMARRAMDASLAMRRRHLLETSPRVLWGRITSIEILLRGRQWEEAEVRARRAIDELAPILPDDHLLLAKFRSRLGRALTHQSRGAEAIPILRAAAAPLSDGAGPAALDVIDTLGTLVYATKQTGDLEGLAEVTHRRAEAIAATTHRISWYRIRGRLEPALDELEAAAEDALRSRDAAKVEAQFARFDARRREAIADDDPRTIMLAGATRVWVDVWLGSGGWSVHSRAALREAERIARQPGVPPLLLAETCALSITHEGRAGDLDRAAAYFEEGMRLLETDPGPFEWVRPRLLAAYGEALVHHGRPHEGLSLLADAHRRARRAHGDAAVSTQEARVLESLARHAIDPDEARRRDAAALGEALSGTPPRPRALDATAWMVARVPGHDAGVYTAALEASGRAYEVMPATWRLARTRAMTQYRAGRYEEALASARLTRERLLGDRPELWAIEAMSHARLAGAESAAEADAALERAEELLACDEFRHDIVAADLVAEARQVVAGLSAEAQ